MQHLQDVDGAVDDGQHDPRCGSAAGPVTFVGDASQFVTVGRPVRVPVDDGTVTPEVDQFGGAHAGQVGDDNRAGPPESGGLPVEGDAAEREGFSPRLSGEVQGGRRRGESGRFRAELGERVGGPLMHGGGDTVGVDTCDPQQRPFIRPAVVADRDAATGPAAAADLRVDGGQLLGAWYVSAVGPTRKLRRLGSCGEDVDGELLDMQQRHRQQRSHDLLGDSSRAVLPTATYAPCDDGGGPTPPGHDRELLGGIGERR